MTQIDLRDKLRSLEHDYFEQPLIAQKLDLQEINKIRATLGMPAVDALLKEPDTAEALVPTTPSPEQQREATDRAQAEEIYEAYLHKRVHLDRQRAYAQKVAAATHGHGQTPVRPLATMGTNGGPLLCDHCKKPILLEGGKFNRMPADAAWRLNPNPNWTSFISGGLLVELLSNGTLRIYHGYPGNQNHCCEIALRERQAAMAKFQPGSGYENRRILATFIEEEFPTKTREQRAELVNEVLDTLYGFDPGEGINKPR